MAGGPLWAKAGFDRLDVANMGTSCREMIDLYAREVLVAVAWCPAVSDRAAVAG